MIKLTEWIKIKSQISGKCPPKMDARTAILFLEKYLLGDDWRDISYNEKQANTVIVWAILEAYSKKFQKELEDLRKERD